jgi:DNA end-binding protein Ku
MPGSKIWTGTLSFVLVSIPVELVSAVRHNRVSFRKMHKKDSMPLERRMYCEKDRTYVHSEHIVNGYEVGEDKYVIVREDEYKALEPKRSQSIEIDSFVDAGSIDSIYFDRPYYILPRKGGAKSYQMLREVMHKSGKAALAKVVMHTREHLVAVFAKEKLLELMTLHYHSQIRDIDELLPSKRAQTAKIRSITEQIKKAAGKYDPARYVDSYRKQVLEFLEEKVRQDQTVRIEQQDDEPEAAEPQSQADLVSALEESLSKVRGK